MWHVNKNKIGTQIRVEEDSNLGGRGVDPHLPRLCYSPATVSPLLKFVGISQNQRLVFDYYKRKFIAQEV